MRAILNYFIKYPASGNVLMGMLVVLGYFSLRNMKSTLFPPIDPRIVTVQVVYPGASPQEIEEGIILKVEENLKGIRGIERISSVSRENSGIVTIEVLKGESQEEVLQNVKNAVDKISSFPVGIEPPMVFKQEPRNFAISFMVYGDVPLKTLKERSRKVESDLRAVEGISQIELSGFPPEEIEIAVNENKLLAYNLTIAEIADAVARNNIEITGGTIKTQNEELLVRAKSKAYYADEMPDIVVKQTIDGGLIRLKDVATVRDIWADNPARTWVNGKPSVTITIQNLLSEDIMFITDYVNNYIKEYNIKSPDVKAELVRDGSKTLRARIELLLKNGQTGAILVLVFLSLFLHPRLAFWVAAGLPISFFGMFIFANYYDISINAISVFGMVLVVGILVDDGIVVSENIYRHFEQGKSRIQAAVDGTLEVIPSVISSVLTTVVAFSSFFFLDGRLGEFITHMAFVVIVTLMISLVEAIFILPAHVAHSKALTQNAKPLITEKYAGGALKWLRTYTYQPVLLWAIKYKYITFAISIGIFIVSFGMVDGGFVKTTFFPFIDRDNVTVSLRLPAGSREVDVNRILTYIEDKAWIANAELSANRPDSLQVFEKIMRKVGPSANEGSIDVTLLEGEIRNVPSFKVSEALRKQVGTIVGVEQLSYDAGAPFGKPVSVALLCENLDQLNQAKFRLKKELSTIKELRDITDTDQPGGREVSIKLKPQAKQLGLRTADVLTFVRNGFFGREVQRLQRGIDEVRVWVRYDTLYRQSLDNLLNMRIKTATGALYPLSEIADVELKTGTIAINHLDGKRQITIEAEMADPTASVTDVNARIETEILPTILADYPNVSASFEGQSRQSAKSAKSAKSVAGVIMLIMFAIIMLTFRSFGQSLTVMLMVFTFGLIGVIWGHFIENAPISMLSAYGIIALLGVLVNDCLVMVSAFNINIKDGMNFKEAIVDAAMSRFRPIILTSLTTIAGLYPLIFERSSQAQFLKPMAISLAYGLLFGTFLMLIVLPALISILNSTRKYSLWLWEGKKPSEEEIEPAHREKKFIEESYASE